MKTKSPLKKRAKHQPMVAAKSLTNGPLTSKLVRLGNSRGVRLPESLIEHAGLKGDDIEIFVEQNRIIIQPATKKVPRADWEERFKKAIAKHGPPEAMDPEWEFMPNAFDEKEWTW